MISRKTVKGDVRVTFSLPLETPAGPVSVVGDFNGWEPGKTVLAKRANGTRSVAVTLKKGTTTKFRYLGENDNWFDDPEADEVTSEGGVITV